MLESDGNDMLLNSASSLPCSVYSGRDVWSYIFSSIKGTLYITLTNPPTLNLIIVLYNNVYYCNSITLTNGMNVHLWIFFFKLLSETCFHEWLLSEWMNQSLLCHTCCVWCHWEVEGRGGTYGTEWRQMAGNRKQSAKRRNPRTQANPNVLPDGNKRSVGVGVWLPSLCRHARPLDGSLCSTA